MAHIKDLWTKPNPNGGKRVHNNRWGKGKRWQARWYEGGREVTRAFETKDAATAHLSRVETAQADGIHITKDKAQVTLADLWEPWIETKADRAKATISCYQDAWVRINIRWGDQPVSSITRLEVDRWIATLHSPRYDRPLSSSAKGHTFGTLKALLELAVDERIIPSNPLARAHRPKQTKAERRYLSVEEIDTLLAAMPDDGSRLMIRVLVSTGIRPGEAFALRVGDLDVDRRRIRISRSLGQDGKVKGTKTGKSRDVPISGALVAELVAHTRGRSATRPLLMRGAVSWKRSLLRSVWRWNSPLEGVTVYELRHTAASLAIASGANVKTVQAMLGHSSAAMTLDVYGHLWPDDLDTLPERVEEFIASERRSKMRVV